MGRSRRRGRVRRPVPEPRRAGRAPLRFRHARRVDRGARRDRLRLGDFLGDRVHRAAFGSRGRGLRRAALRALGLAALGGSFLWALPGIADYLHFMMRERTPVLDWPYGVVYSVFLAAAVTVVLRCLAAIVHPEASDKA